MAKKKKKLLKICRSNKFSLLVLLSVILVMGVMLQKMHNQLSYARAEQTMYAQRLTLLQEQNNKLAEDIANSTNPELIENIARNQLGMAFPGEKIFRFRR